MLRRSVLIQRVLRDVQSELESRRASEAVKQQQRAVMRGFRAGFGSMVERLSLEDIEQVLREELGFPAQTECANSGTTIEVESGKKGK